MDERVTIIHRHAPSHKEVHTIIIIIIIIITTTDLSMGNDRLVWSEGDSLRGRRPVSSAPPVRRQTAGRGVSSPGEENKRSACTRSKESLRLAGGGGEGGGGLGLRDGPRLGGDEEEMEAGRSRGGGGGGGPPGVESPGQVLQKVHVVDLGLRGGDGKHLGMSHTVRRVTSRQPRDSSNIS